MDLCGPTCADDHDGEDGTPSHAVVFDFDGTLTRKDEAIFHLLDHRALPPAGTAEAIARNALYVERARAGHLTREEERRWLDESIDLYIRSGLTDRLVRQTLAAVDLRPGVRECLQALAAAGLPVAVISYGCQEFIRLMFERAGIGVPELVWSIYAARLRRDPATGRYTGVDAQTFVLPSDKGHCSLDFAAAYGVSPDRILAVGDSGGDRLLGHLKENRFGLARDEAEAAIIAPHFGQVAVTEDFGPIRSWLRIKTSLTLP